MSDKTTLRRVAGGAIIAVMAASAAYSANTFNLRDRLSPPAQRLGDRPSGAAPTAVAEAGPAPALTTSLDRRSQPWWQQVATFEGEGPFTSPRFEIADHALQWRVTWQCTRGPFSVVPVTTTGSELHKVADVASCTNEERTGFSNKPGSNLLRVSGSGQWKLKIDQQLDLPRIENLTPEMTSSDARVIGQGSFYDVDRVGKGTARIYRLADGSQVIRLEDFFVSINSDLEIWLSTLPAPKTTDEIADAPSKAVDFLKATTGSMNYSIPAGVNLADYKSIVIWCDITHNAYAAAALAGP